MSTVEISEELRKNFHLFWDNFPFPVMLVYQDRTILEANKAGQAVGCPVGTRCSDIGEKKFHATCQANRALREQTGIRDVAYIEQMGVVMDSYWVPLAGSDDIYIHFGADITAYAAERLFPEKQEQCGCECSR